MMIENAENISLVAPQGNQTNKKISELIDELASSGEEMDSKIKSFRDLLMALDQKSPREVFEEFDSHMLEENPRNHLTLIDILFNTVGPEAKEYNQSIKWLKDNNKLNFYIEHVAKQFPNMIDYFPETIVKVLQNIVNTMEEIPSEASLVLIPHLLELLSPGNKWFEIPEVLISLYVITQKTKDNDDWNQDFINKICTAIVPFVETKQPQDVRMYTYATLANLPFVHTSNLFTSKGINHVPDDVIRSAQMSGQEVLTDRLRKLQVIDHVPKDVIIHAGMGMDGYMKDRLKKLNEQLSKTKSGSDTEPSKQPPREWNRTSKRFSQQLEKLANTHEVDKVVKAGHVVMGKGDEFRIAKGHGTDVFLGLKSDGTEAAVKRMTKTNYGVLKNEQYLLRLPELINHPSILRYLDFVEDENFGYLVLQLCEYNLEEYIKKGIEFPEQVIAQQVLTSLKILHHQKPPILHRDIKPGNVLIDERGNAKLADLGISRELPEGQTSLLTSSAGTKCWKAKETINEDGDVPYTRSADIQVAGMLLYYILSRGYHPFGKSARCEGNILDGNYNLEHVKDVLAKGLIKSMINEDPEKRLSVEECLAHPYFWKNEKRLNFLEKVANEQEIDKHYNNSGHKDLMAVWNQQCTKEGQHFSTWINTMEVKLPKDVFEKMKKMRAKHPYQDDGFALLRYTRNLQQHHKKAVAAAGIDLMEMFPGLLLCVYKFTLKQGWNKRDTLKDCFQ